MGGLIVGVVVVYAVRRLIWLFSALRTSSWIPTDACVAVASCPMISFGCPLCEVSYVYELEGESYSGFASVPFFWQSSAESYSRMLTPGTHVVVRFRPESPICSFFASGLGDGRGN